MVLISGIFYLLPLTFYNSLYNDYAIYYKSIHVDAILGIAVGYATWLFACKPWRSRYKTIQFALSLSFLVLVKSSGIVFAGILLASTFLYLFIYERNALRKKHIYCLGLPLILYILWQICLNTYATTDSVGYAVSDVINFQFAKEFMAALMTKSIMLPRTAELAKYCTFGTIALWLISLYFILWRLCREQVKEKRMTKWAFVTLVIQLIVFIFGLYGLCVGPFKSTLLSYGRYISTILTAFFVYWCFQFIHEFDAVAKGIRADGKKWAILIVLDFMVLVIFYPLYRPMAISYPQSALRDADKIEHIVNSHVGYSGNGAYDNAVMIVDKAYDSYSPDLHLYLQRRLYFDMIDEKIQINQKLYFDEEIVIQKEQDGELLLVTENGWPECDYVFWVNYVDDANKFVDLYKVISIENNVLCLQQIASQDVN